MQRVAVLTLTVLFGLAAVAKADPVITLGTYTIAPGVPVTAIPIFVHNDPTSGSHNSVQALVFDITIGNGDGSAGPKFVLGTPGQGGSATNSGYVGPASGLATGGDTVTGTIFAATTHINPVDGGGSTSQDLQISIGVSSGPNAQLVDGPGQSLLATIYVSTVGVTAGTQWALKIGGENVNPGVIGADGSDPNNGPLSFGDDAITQALTDGIISIVPEPTSIVMALFGAAGLAAVAIRRRRA